MPSKVVKGKISSSATYVGVQSRSWVSAEYRCFIESLRAGFCGDTVISALLSAARR